jgi:ribonuclease T1
MLNPASKRNFTRMKPINRNSIGILLIVLAVAFLASNSIDCNEFGLNPPESSSVTTSAATVTASNAKIINLNELPPEARTTLQLIKKKGPFPYSKDGAVFNNIEGLLPTKPNGYYHEYTVVTPGSSDRGARRIISGSNGKYYYTDDHYVSFRLIVE